MAFLKHAKAKVQKPDIKLAEWSTLTSKALTPAPDFQKRTAQVVLDEYDPSRYMLSHATIVASVDVEKGPGEVGRHFEEGFEVNRPYQEYYITAETEGLINNNFDSFERKLLLATYKTFVGAQSYVEHVQVPELSKGRIIDAAARDVGNSIYIDILIANELKHRPLIQAIKSGQLGTLSMGCSCTFSICTKCGNVAKDETELCFHIKHFKGEPFIDELGNKRKIAELVGHHTDAESCKFVEASWVANPAFKGAVIRNILNETEADSLAQKIHVAFSAPAPTHQKGALAKAARLMFAQGEEMGDEQQTAVPDGTQADPAAAPAAPAPEPDPIDKAVQDLTEAIRTKAIEQVRKEVNKTEIKDDNNPNLQNESLIKSAMQNPAWRKVAANVIKNVGKPQAKRIMLGLLLHKEGGWTKLARSGFTGKEILAVSRILDTMQRRTAMAGETNVYRAVIDVGGIGPYENEETYLAACRQVLGRVLTGSEASMLLQKGRLFALGKKRQ